MKKTTFALIPDGREFPVIEATVIEQRTEVRRGREVTVVVARAGNKFFRHAVNDDLFPGDVLFATREEAEAASAQRQAEAAEAERQREQFLSRLSNAELCAHMAGARNGWTGD
jgi:energy-coupling factor transporter ATP-binding protein EcfA2